MPGVAVSSVHRPLAIIDDDEAILESYAFWFQTLGIATTTYSSALAYLADDGACPCGLIVDQNMPRMTGIGLLARLHALGVAVPALLITSAISPGLIAEAAAHGVDRVLEKPAAEDVLLAFVAACRGL